MARFSFSLHLLHSSPLRYAGEDNELKEFMNLIRSLYTPSVPHSSHIGIRE